MKTKTTKTKRTPKTLVEVLAPAPRIDAALLDALRKTNLTCYEIGKRSGIDKAVLSRFKAGRRDLKLATAAALADVLGLRLVNGKV